VAKFAAPVIAIAVNDLAEQGDFAHALGDQAAHFIDNLLDRTAAFDATPEGDDTEGAGVAAAIDDRHMGCDRCLPAEGKMLDGLLRADRLEFILEAVASHNLLTLQL